MCSAVQVHNILLIWALFTQSPNYRSARFSFSFTGNKLPLVIGRNVHWYNQHLLLVRPYVDEVFLTWIQQMHRNDGSVLEQKRTLFVRLWICYIQQKSNHCIAFSYLIVEYMQILYRISLAKIKARWKCSHTRIGSTNNWRMSAEWNFMGRYNACRKSENEQLLLSTIANKRERTLRKTKH